MESLLAAVTSAAQANGTAASSATADTGPAVDLAPVFGAIVRASAPVPARAHTHTHPNARAGASAGAADAAASTPTGAVTFDSLTSMYPTFGTELSAVRGRLLKLLGSVLELVEPGHGREIASKFSETAGLDGDDHAFEEAAEMLDRMREAAESFIDEARGHHSSQQIARVQNALNAAAAQRTDARSSRGNNNFRRAPVASANVTHKPQDDFVDAPVDNSRDSPFISRLTEKYHAGVAPPSATRPAYSLRAEPYRSEAGVHPYMEELENLIHADWQLQRAQPPAEFQNLDSVDFEFVDTPAKLAKMVEYLDGTRPDMSDAATLRIPPSLCGPGAARPVAELAIDLEAHNLRSFQGFTCLMQLSTRDRDYIIDTLALRSELHVLNRVFADPRVTKVLHGCDSDVVWLQRDFGVYLVNVFDTGQASRLLAYPSFGLAHLLQYFAGVTANKEFQTADWRERPLPPHLIKYAREDTHYLLGIYDRVKNALIDSSAGFRTWRVVDSKSGAFVDAEVPELLAAALERSRDKTMAVYEKEPYSPTAFRRLMVKMGYSEKQQADAPEADAPDAWIPRTPFAAAFAALYEWRDRVAREDDESPFFILSNRHLARLAETRPASMEALVREINPLPDAVRARAEDVIAVLRGASAGGDLIASARPARAEAGIAGTKRRYELSSVATNDRRSTISQAGSEADLRVLKRGREANNSDLATLAGGALPQPIHAPTTTDALVTCLPAATRTPMATSAGDFVVCGAITQALSVGEHSRPSTPEHGHSSVADAGARVEAAQSIMQSIEKINVLDLLGWRLAYLQLATAAAVADAERSAAHSHSAAETQQESNNEEIVSVAQRHAAPASAGAAAHAKKPRMEKPAAAARDRTAPVVQPFDYTSAASAAIRESLSALANQPRQASAVELPTAAAPGARRGRGGKANPYLAKRR